jgi:hypothetical protein
MNESTYVRLRAALLGERTIESLVAEHQAHPQKAGFEMIEEAQREPVIPADAARRLGEALGLPDDRVPAGAHARLYAAVTGRAAPDRPEPGAGRREEPITERREAPTTRTLDDPALSEGARTLIEAARAAHRARGGAA